MLLGKLRESSVGIGRLQSLRAAAYNWLLFLKVDSAGSFPFNCVSLKDDSPSSACSQSAQPHSKSAHDSAARAGQYTDE